MNTEERIERILKDLKMLELSDYNEEIFRLELEALVIQAQLEYLEKEK